MIKKLFSMMACAALVFGMAACSDEDPAPNKGNGGGTGGNQEEAENLFVEGLYLSYTIYDEEGMPMEDKDGNPYSCIMQLLANTEDDNIYGLYNPLNTGVLLMGELKAGTKDKSRLELAFNGAFMYEDENGNTVAPETSLYDQVMQYLSYEDMMKSGYTQQQIEQGFLSVWPDSDGVMFYITPCTWDTTSKKYNLDAEFRICTYYEKATKHDEMSPVNDLGYCYQGAKELSATELQPVGDTFYSLEALWAGDLMWELVSDGEYVDFAERYYKMSAQSLTRNAMLKDCLKKENKTFAPTQYRIVR